MRRALELGCIADDYTGASDLANSLTQAGLRTVQAIGVPAPDLALPEVDAVVIALKSRSIRPADAVEKSRAAETWLRAAGVRHILFKICSTFDSTDEGNIGPVMDALLADAREDIALVTPAFPETGRTVYKGHLFVGDLPLNESPLKDHPLNPMRDSDLRRVLGRQSGRRIGLVDLKTVARGVEAVRNRLAQSVNAGFGAAIVDSVFDSDLETIGVVALDHKVSVGASGLGLGLARGLIASGRVARRPPAASDEEALGGSALCLAGSCSAATLAQIARAEAHLPVYRLDPEQLLAGPAEIQRALDWAVARLKTGPLLIASSAAPGEVSALQARHGRESAGTAIEQAMASLAEALVATGVRRLVVAGGETSGAVVDRLGIPAFLLGPEIAPGVPVLTTVGSAAAPWAKMKLALKSGNFGGPDFFTDALSLMP